MRIPIYCFLLILLSLALGSCSNQQYQALFEQKKLLTDTVVVNKSASIDNYRIQPQDILQIKNLQDIKAIAIESSSTGAGGGSATASGQTFQVEEDGTVALPALGHIIVAGLTRTEASKQIEELYRKNLLKDPIIELKIVNLKVTILGEIRSQGNFPLTKDRTTLVEMIGTAGGLTDKANETNIKIIRGTQQNPQVTEIDLSNIRSINDPKALLQNGDIIYIAENKRAVRTDKLQNFSTLFQPALLLFNTALIIFTLIRR